VQTLRNSILVAVFIGGYAFQNGVSALTSIKTDGLDLHDKIATGIVALLMFLSFLCWATVIRCASHLGYHIGVLSHMFASQPSKPVPPPVTTDAIQPAGPCSNEGGIVPQIIVEGRTEIDRKREYCNNLIRRLMFNYR
jgi:hypothetical protein